MTLMYKRNNATTIFAGVQSRVRIGTEVLLMVGSYQHSSGLRACVIGCAVDEGKIARPFAEK
jgi:hypothetical protein